ncbi:MAG: hypothetical protein V4726_06890 [Verrucomicrobiota bacterium]
MAVKRAAYWLIPAFGLTFAAGWFCRGQPGSEAAERSRLVTRTMAPGASVSGGSSPEAAPPGAPLAEIRPLTSLAEILELLRLMDGRDELAMVPVMNMLPRLMITDIPTVRRLLDELAAEAVNHKGNDAFSAAAGALIFRWMTLQPEEAAVYALEHQGAFKKLDDICPLFVAYAGATRAGAGERLLARVEEKDRDKMGELLRKIQLMSDPATSLRDPATFEKLNPHEIQELAGKWMKDDPSGVLAWRGTLPEGDKRKIADGAVLELAVDPKMDPAARDQLLAGLPPELASAVRLKRLAVEIRMAGDKTEANPPTGATYAAQLTTLLSQQPVDPDHPAMIEAVAGTGEVFLKQRQFSEAAAWLGTLPPGEGQKNAARQLAESWAADDPASASAWIDALPPGENRDLASSQLIDVIQKEDPAAALVWAHSLRDESARLPKVREIYATWFQSDPAAASQAVQSLPPDQQRQLSKSGGKGGQQQPSSDFLAPELRRAQEKNRR